MATRTSSPARASKGSSRTSSAGTSRTTGAAHDPSTLPLPVRALRTGYLAIARMVGGFVRSIGVADRKSTRLNSSHVAISYAVFCLKKKKKKQVDYTYQFIPITMSTGELQHTEE